MYGEKRFMNLLDYIRGNRKGKNAHELEKEAMKDPFLSDALEGYQKNPGDHERNLQEMQDLVTSEKKENFASFHYWSIAASILVLIGVVSVLLYFRTTGDAPLLVDRQESIEHIRDIDSPVYIEFPELAEMESGKGNELAFNEENKMMDRVLEDTSVSSMVSEDLLADASEEIAEPEIFSVQKELIDSRQQSQAKIQLEEINLTEGLAMSKRAKQTESDFYNFTVKDIQGNDFSLSQLKGKKVMVVNVASRCGLTPQYEELQKLYEKYKDKNFTIIAFPANNFNEQEPGTNQAILEFCKQNYGVTFPIMEKISVRGNDIHPLYKWLTREELNGKSNAEVEWNFQKFLIDENGNWVKSIQPQVSPLSEEIISWIEPGK